MTSKKSSAQSPRWQQLLAEARKLRSESGSGIYRRAKILVQVYEDRDWRLKANQVDDEKAMAILDNEVNDTACSFAQLRGMLQFFPKAEQWAEGMIGRMRDEYLESHRLARKTEGSRVERRRATVKELDEMEARATVAETRADSLSAELREIRAENQELRRSLDRAEGRIMELEKLLSYDEAAA